MVTEFIMFHKGKNDTGTHPLHIFLYRSMFKFIDEAGNGLYKEWKKQKASMEDGLVDPETYNSGCSLSSALTKQF